MWEIFSSSMKLQQRMKSAQPPHSKFFAWKLTCNLGWVQEVIKKNQMRKIYQRLLKQRYVALDK